MSQVLDEAELAWQKQQEAMQHANGDGEGGPPEGEEEEDDEEAERMWQMMQEQLQRENEEARRLEELRQENELKLSAADDDDGIYKGELTIPYESLTYDKEPVTGGNFGKIFKGDFLGTEVAIKKFAFEEDVKYVEREVEILKAIRHPNIVTFLGVCQHQGSLYVVTEWVARGDLTHELQQDKPISWRQRVLYAKDACAAIAYLHQLGVIHRDIKPDNMLLTDNNRIKMCDLGFARTAKKTKRMSIAGTGLYMAPEVMIGDQYDWKCDVFSFGASLLEMITRKPPPQRNIDEMFRFDFDELRKLIPPECPEELHDLCLECLLPDPEDRPLMKDIIPRLSLLATQLPVDEEGISEEQRRLEDEAEKAFLLEAEKSLKENQKFLEAVKEIEEEAKLTPEDLEAAKKEMEKKMKAEIEKEVQTRLDEERRRLRQEMERELDTTKAILKSSMSTGEMRSQLNNPKDRNKAPTTTLKKRNSLNMEEIQQAKEALKKEGKILKKEKEELKKEEKELKKEQKQNRLSLRKKNREEALAQSRLSWGSAKGKEHLTQSMAAPSKSPNGSAASLKDLSADDEDEIPPWKPANANGNAKKDSPTSSNGTATKIAEPPKKETKKEKKEREKEEKKEKERQKKEKKEREKQEKLLRAQVKKQKVLGERQHKKEQERASKTANEKDNERDNNKKKKTDSGRSDKGSAIPITNSGILYG